MRVHVDKDVCLLPTATITTTATTTTTITTTATTTTICGPIAKMRVHVDKDVCLLPVDALGDGDGSQGTHIMEAIIAHRRLRWCQRVLVLSAV